MWFAFKFLPLQYLRQHTLRVFVRERVVICFQILTFAVSATARFLWVWRGGGCDLLSNSYLCSICDSQQRFFFWNTEVVICFQILTFAVSATATCTIFISKGQLWFAFKFLPLQYLRQHPYNRKSNLFGCDLLSNSYLCSICDSIKVCSVLKWYVVICFQILTFAVSATASRIRGSNNPKLWFAFKFLPLQYLRQLCILIILLVVSCDLLSNSYLCSICDSACARRADKLQVVICFQILTFAVSATANMISQTISQGLWFAFKFLPLQYLRQLNPDKSLLT